MNGFAVRLRVEGEKARSRLFFRGIAETGPQS